MPETAQKNCSSMKTQQHVMKINENQWKSMKINENQQNSMPK